MADPSRYTLGAPGKDVYASHEGGQRQGVLDIGREMAELTIPSVLPPEDYQAGDPLPGNNQSLGAQLVGNLANKLMFMAFPPGQPIMRWPPKGNSVQQEVRQNPAMWAELQVALSQLEILHRDRFASTPMKDTYVNYMKLLLIAGNGLWKQLKLDEPSFFRPDTYIVIRTASFVPLTVVHKETVLFDTLDPDIQDALKALPDFEEKMQDQKDKPLWEREVCIYSCQKVHVEDGGERVWDYWQEWEGHPLEGTEVTTDYDTPPMWPGYLIPVYGSHWARSYCEEYRGDLFTLEANSSSLNDIAALLALALTFVKPGSQTSIKQVRTAKNLSVLPGNAEDVTVFRSEKTADQNGTITHLEMVARRLSSAFLLQSSIQRSGERVTKEEIVRLGSELDQAMGGLYTQNSQSNQLVIFKRAVRLHEEEDPTLPDPTEGGKLTMQVHSGVDALGNSTEWTNHVEWASTNQALFPNTWEQIADGRDFATRTAAMRGIKPDGLVKSQEQLAADQQQAQQQALIQSAMDKGIGPAVKGMADMATSQQPQQQPEGAA